MSDLPVALGWVLVLGGFAFIFFVRYIYPRTDMEPFDGQTKNQLWNYFLPYLFGLAILGCVVGAAILQKNGMWFD